MGTVAVAAKPTLKQSKSDKPALAKKAPSTAMATPVPDLIQRACACGGGCPDCAAKDEDTDRLLTMVQAKLKVGAVNDPLEREADRVADQVMRMSDAEVAERAASGLQRAPQITPLASVPAQHQCPECEEKLLQAKAEPGGTVDVSSKAEAAITALKGGGQPLPAPERAFFEPRFGRSFENVRIHTGPCADKAARGINAQAFTYGSDIALAQGEYQPHLDASRRLMAHELVHVIQQRDVATAAHLSGNDSISLQYNRTSVDSIQRTVSEGCLAPSLVVTPVIASLFGTVAETLIEPDYIAQKGGTPFGDVFLDNPMGAMSYISFLASHHPHLEVPLLAAQISLSGGVLIPDILDTRADDLYEIKPNSLSGRTAGRGKLAAIDAFMAYNSLPYTRGMNYTPNLSIPIPLGSVALAPFLGLPTLIACGVPNVSLKTVRSANGLLLYEICVEADFNCWLEVFALEALIAAIILAILVSRGIPLPIPQPPVPVVA